MSETIWSEDYVSRNPKLAAHAIEFLQEMLRTEEIESQRTIKQLQGRVSGLEFELALLVEQMTHSQSSS
jgi:hypothetical protein